MIEMTKGQYVAVLSLFAAQAGIFGSTAAIFGATIEGILLGGLTATGIGIAIAGLTIGIIAATGFTWKKTEEAEKVKKVICDKLGDPSYKYGLLDRFNLTLNEQKTSIDQFLESYLRN